MPEKMSIENHPLYKWRHTFDPPMTQQELANKIGHDRSTVIRVEKCQQQPRGRFIQTVEDLTLRAVTGIDMMSFMMAFCSQEAANG